MRAPTGPRRGCSPPTVSRLARAVAGSAALASMLACSTLPTPAARAADLEAGRRQAAAACASCHGLDGNSTDPRFPSLAGQQAVYIHWQLILFRDNRRRSPEMSPFAANLSDAEIANLAVYYAAQAPQPPPAAPHDPDKIAAGQRAFERHHCVSCHAAAFTGQQYAPRLAGLHYEYLLRQLQGFKNQTRAELDGTMTMAAQPLTEQDIESLAYYIAYGLP